MIAIQISVMIKFARRHRKTGILVHKIMNVLLSCIVIRSYQPTRLVNAQVNLKKVHNVRMEISVLTGHFVIKIYARKKRLYRRDRFLTTEI